MESSKGVTPASLALLFKTALFQLTTGTEKLQGSENKLGPFVLEIWELARSIQGHTPSTETDETATSEDCPDQLDSNFDFWTEELSLLLASQYPFCWKLVRLVATCREPPLPGAAGLMRCPTKADLDHLGLDGVIAPDAQSLLALKGIGPDLFTVVDLTKGHGKVDIHHADRNNITFVTNRRESAATDGEVKYEKEVVFVINEQDDKICFPTEDFAWFRASTVA